MEIHAYHHLSSGIAILLLLQLPDLVNITTQVQASLSPPSFIVGQENTTGRTNPTPLSNEVFNLHRPCLHLKGRCLMGDTASLLILVSQSDPLCFRFRVFLYCITYRVSDFMYFQISPHSLLIPLLKLWRSRRRM